jgi:molybdate transport system regulatory protein
MNKIPGTITQIQQSGAILLVDIDVDGHQFSALLVQSATPPDWLLAGNPIDVVFKETEVSIAKDLSGIISMRNRMKCTVLQIERGELLSKIDLKFQNFLISSAITTRSVDALELNIGDEVEALVKANEVALMKKKI